jgi:osmoprotectant transport system substrate-binding protein
MSQRWRSGKPWVVIICLLLLISACAPRVKTGTEIVVASSDTLEQEVVGKMTVLALQRAGYDVVDRAGLGSPWMVRAALEADNVDVCWGYTDEAWTVHLGHDYPISDPGELFTKVHDEDILNEITWLSPCEWDRRRSLVVQESFAEKNEIMTLGDLAHYVRDVNPNVTLCTPQELCDSAAGIRGLERVYAFHFKRQQVQFLSMEEGYEALVEGDCHCALGFSADAALAHESLRFLEDDEGFFHASSLAPMVRTPILRESPGVERILIELSSALTKEVMREIHHRTIVEGQKPTNVARRMLRKCDI